MVHCALPLYNLCTYIQYTWEPNMCCGTYACCLSLYPLHCLSLIIWSPPPWCPFAVGPPSSWCSVAMRPSRAGGAWWVLWTLQRLRKRTPTGGRGKGTVGGRGRGTGGGRGGCIVIAHVAWIEPSTVLCRTCWGVGWDKLRLLNVICTLCKYYS